MSRRQAPLIYVLQFILQVGILLHFPRGFQVHSADLLQIPSTHNLLDWPLYQNFVAICPLRSTVFLPDSCCFVKDRSRSHRLDHCSVVGGVFSTIFPFCGLHLPYNEFSCFFELLLLKKPKKLWLSLRVASCSRQVLLLVSHFPRSNMNEINSQLKGDK